MSTTLRDVARVHTRSADGLRILNLTGHAVAMHVGRSTVTFEPAALTARVEYHAHPLPPIRWQDDDGATVLLPRRRVKRGQIYNLPAAEDDVLLLVSRIVASYAPERTDLLVPDGVMRDSRGAAFACRYLTEVDESG